MWQCVPSASTTANAAYRSVKPLRLWIRTPKASRLPSADHCGPPREATWRLPLPLVRVVVERRIRKSAQLLQRLVLDLADPLARDVERPPHLLERARFPAVETVTQLEHATLALRQCAQDLVERLPAHRDLCRLVCQRHVVVCEEVAELRLSLVTDRLLERHR